MNNSGVLGGSTSFFPIAKSDAVEITEPHRALYIGAEGDLAVIGWNEEDDLVVTFTGLQAGQILDISARKVLSTGSTANNIVGLR
jgi:hypothetical protein